MKLVIVESPGKVPTIQKILGEEYHVIASYGHICEIHPKGLNIDVTSGSFKPNVRIVPGKEDVVKLVQTMAATAKEVFICTDADREGSRIAWDLSQAIKSPEKVKRAVFHEITKKSINHAIQNAGDIDVDRVNSQFARQILDRLIGYLVSPMLWSEVPGGKSAGRVQSVALRLVAEREYAIDAFDPEQFWNIPVTFDVDGQVVEGVVQTSEKDNRIPELKMAEAAAAIVKENDAVVQSVKCGKLTRRPMAPFDTASLQKQASATFGWSGKKTMEVAQGVYEAGYCTYHRTDSFVVADEAYEACVEYIAETYSKKYLPEERRVYEKKSRSQEAHECIRPTSVSGNSWSDGVDLKPDEQKLYEMIRSRFIASQMADLEYDKTVVAVRFGRVKVGVEGKAIRFDGWTKVWPLQGKEVFLPKIEKGDVLKVTEVQVKEHVTKPPKRYNDGTLVAKMEKEGVGRPSTWAVLVDSLVRRGYVTKDGKNFVLTPVGRSVCQFLMAKFSDFFMDIEFTSLVEDELERIGQGEADKIDVIRGFYSRLSDIVYADRNEAWAELFD